MKNAMKKLMSLLLVAVLLVSAIPFGALAAEFDPTAGMNDNDVVVNGSVVEEVVEEIPLAPVTKSVAAASVTTPVTVLVVIDYSDKADVTGEITVNAGTSAYAALCEIADAATVAEIQNNYAVTYSADSVAVGMNKLTVTCVRKPVVVNEYYVEIDIEGSEQGNTKVYKEGDVLTLNESLLTAFDLSVPAGEKIAKFIVNNADKAIGDTHTVAGGTKIVVVTVPADANTGSGSNNGGSTSNTAYHVDVILVNDSRTSGFASNEYHHCVLVNGKITQADRDAIAAKMPAGTIAWRRGDNGTQSNSLLNFDFSDLTKSINVFPVVQTTSGNTNVGTNVNGSAANTTATVTFLNYNGGTMYTATATNGKLTATDVNNATNAAVRTGYTFAGWKVNNAGSAAASDLLLNMTFADGDKLYPTYTANSNILSSTKNQNDIFLNIFVNKDFQNCKTIKLNEHWVIADDKVTKDEILQYVVTDYYKAANGNIGLQADMLYYSVGSFMYNWLTDNGTLTIDNISAKRAQGTVTINIMVTNAAVTGSSAAADTSNPKTGDEIYTAMAVMGISAASLAAVMYFYNKKRMAI